MAPVSDERPSLGDPSKLHGKQSRAKFLYDNAKSESPDPDYNLFTLWSNILPHYFDICKSYVCEVPPRPVPGVEPDSQIIAVRHIANIPREDEPPSSAYQDSIKVAFIVDECFSDESSTARWEQAVEQVTKYMTVVRTDSIDPSGYTKTMYAIVTVGLHSRFYELREGEEKLRDYEDTNGRTYEFKDDEELIDGLLLDIVRKTH